MRIVIIDSGRSTYAAHALSEGSTMTIRHCFLIVAAAIALNLAPAEAAPASEQKAQTVVHMLDYVSVDYPNFVKDAKVVNPGEYAEQKEFAGQAIELLEQLPAAPAKPALLEKARQLLSRIDAKGDGAQVTALAVGLRADVIAAYALTVAPKAAPDLANGAKLFAANCAACHGASGMGDGTLAKAMQPHPSNFHDEARMQQRSIYGLYNTIALGVNGTPMRAWTELGEADRWALAFFVSGLRAQPQAITQGEALWKQGKGKAEIASYKALVTAAPAELAAKSPELDQVRAYLTAHPEAIQAVAAAPLDVTRSRLAESLVAYRAGKRDAARELAISAYLEGFELVEAGLNNVDAPLRAETEKEMIALRSSIADGQPVAQVQAQIDHITGLLKRVDAKLAEGNMSPTAAFVSSLLILLREGLEAILVLAAIMAFVKKTGRRDALVWVHAGWIAAAALGVATWAIASYMLGISGASRELTEGFTALLAAAMLLYVGYWLHSKSYAQAWNSFIKEQVSSALGKSTLWAMAGISFLAVYREIFEVILFYETLWVQVGPEGHGVVLGGIAAAAVLLALVGGAILKYSVRLPIGPFFAWTSGLLALMAVVFTGNGIKALQEAGMIHVTAVDFISIPLLGVRPNLQGLGAQLAALAIVLAGMWLSKRHAASAALAPGQPTRA
jgi:high-affinity iron transporter